MFRPDVDVSVILGYNLTCLQPYPLRLQGLTRQATMLSWLSAATQLKLRPCNIDELQTMCIKQVPDARLCCIAESVASDTKPLDCGT